MPLFPPQDYRKTEFTHRIGLAAARPAASDVLIGTFYFSTDTLVLERSNGAIWASYSGIAANSITMAMLAQVATATVLGRSAAGTGDVSALTTLPNAIQDVITRLGTIVLGFVTNAVAALTTAAESWIGPSSTTGIYFKAGNVGIGTTGPASKLQVASGYVTIANGNSAVLSEVLRFNRNEDANRYNSIYNYSDDSGNARIDFLIHDGVTGTSQATVMSLKGTGNVGIGTTLIPSLLTVAGLINTKNYTVATLPAGTRGDIAYVTDALAPAFLAVIVGGGAVVAPVFYNGTNWVGF